MTSALENLFAMQLDAAGLTPNPAVRQAQSIVGYSDKRANNDFYPTPREGTEALLSRIRFDKRVWECACGDGAISKVLIDHGHDVISTDLFDYGYGTSGVDFLKTSSEYRESLGAETIVTNPPYKSAESFLSQAHYIGIKTLAMLLKLSFLEGQSRKELFAKLPPAWVLVFSKRLTFNKNGIEKSGTGMIAFAWFIWQFDQAKTTEIGWL